MSEETSKAPEDITAVRSAFKDGEQDWPARSFRTIGEVLEADDGLRYDPEKKEELTARLRRLFLKDLNEMQHSGDECELADAFFSGSAGLEYCKCSRRLQSGQASV